ncbi:multicopper oxidase domain-containing protein [Longimicrobium sp.]|uniref:multicopper oxidase domain-containing protein n=1 Tax=Longimicrobium sp. TaxID=2029185 RepID=UPI002B7F5D3A|nr:multicopper oxidase domain-containing protein [Longimicrobium sp.]HSU15686.1 multicopper oxidase domain-containing protein [Longimicrobium sp.]
MVWQHRPRPPGRGTPRIALALLLAAAGAAPLSAQCTKTKVARVAALEQFVWYNRLGANAPDALMFALEQDVVSSTGGAASAGNAQLRAGRRPRPLVLRVNAGECLQITLRNLLSVRNAAHPDSTRQVSIHVNGMQLVNSIVDDGSWVQKNASGLVGPGASITYTLFAEKEGTHLLYSTAQMTGGEGDGGQIDRGLFGAVNVEPAGAEYYRSQVTAEDMRLASLVSGVAQTVNGYPKISYTALYPGAHPLAGRPILNMLKGDTIVWSDISAIITGPNRGNFASSAYPTPVVPVFPDRLKPFREHTVIFHDEVGLVQAFNPIFDSTTFKFTLQGGRDAFAINYGTGGIGAEILANRFGLGPMWRCNDCKFEEFFLSSWAVGDPAMVVDVPAAADFDPAHPPVPGPRATKALFPEDPSNVFHSYINDHVKIRNLHAGPKEHHIFHLHAHQWTNTPNDVNSSYKDSQAIGPGGEYTYEITYGGSGNRNDTPGDAIFHCHFYPHFAQGMWGLWRNHDVFEGGTVLDASGRPAAGARALPDGEIAVGTPIPAVVPMPTYALAPLPTDSVPGYPFYIPGVAGHRPPQPPMDLAFDGGLRRHVVTGGVATFPALNTRDFSKHDSLLTVTTLANNGTATELAAMRYHARLGYTTPIANSWASTGTFETNGLPPAPGAPFADPCGIRGVRMGDSLDYKAAGFQITALYNKARWSFSQHRMFALWADVAGFVNGTRAPEPLFFRAQNNSCLTYHLVNLIPPEYRVDDFQVQTPTDIIGQHIHLVKFDVTSSDGAANGWNYEDGALSPGAVREAIRAIRRQNGCTGLNSGDTRDGNATCPVAKYHTYTGFQGDTAWKGAQENIQRWWVDPVPRGGDTTALPTVFTHDHFGPSTHQQVGLYAGLLPEDRGTTWRDPETGTTFGGRFDGGPTSWRADILYAAAPTLNHREFGIQIADFSLAYGAEGFAGTSTRVPPINPPGKFEVGLPNLIRPPLAGQCPNGTSSALGCPEIISANDPGTMLINYRNEPVAMRVRNHPNNSQSAGNGGDLSLAYSNEPFRQDARFDSIGPYGRRPGEQDRDPFTPLMRTYEDDRILVRLLVGAHEEGHNWGINGTRWLFERLSPNSGYRASQMAGISEWHEFNLNPLMTNRLDTLADYQYRGGSAVDDQWHGQWGVIRAYRRTRTDLLRLSTTAPVSTSLNAADADAAAGRKATLSGASTFSTASTFPNPNDPATWEGDVATLDASASTATATQQQAFATGTATASDSVQAGYGTESEGGIDHETFDYDPAAGQETLTTSDPNVATKSPSLALQQDATSVSSAAVIAPDESFAPATTTYTSQPGSLNVGFWGVCPRVAPLRVFEVSAIPATALPNGRLTYNTRTTNGGPLYDPTAVVYVFDADLVSGKLNRNPEPLVLRANAGDCILVRLRNRLPATLPDSSGFNTLPVIVDRFNANQVRPSSRVGLQAQLLSLDVQRSDGASIGLNRNTTVAPGRWRWYQWYAGTVLPTGTGRLRARPVEFGAVNLVSPDRIQHSNKGAFAALVVEPSLTHWTVNPANRAEAVVRRDSDNGVAFKEGVLLFQDDVNLRFGSAATLPAVSCAHPDGPVPAACATSTTGVATHTFAAGSAVPNTAQAEDPEDSGQKGLNYRTEPMWFRMGFAPDAELGFTRGLQFNDVLKNDSAQTPIFRPVAGDSVRLRVLEPQGHARNHTFVLHGHIWEQEPYGRNSRAIIHNPLSEWKGARDGHGPGEHFDIVPRHGAGGLYRVPGDYLFRDEASFGFDGGIWGILRVLANSVGTTSPTPAPMEPVDSCTMDPQTGQTVCQ